MTDPWVLEGFGDVCGWVVGLDVPPHAGDSVPEGGFEWEEGAFFAGFAD